jgi:hypothetical protein
MAPELTPAYHAVSLAYAHLYRFNDGQQLLEHHWLEAQSEYPLEPVSLSWWPGIHDGTVDLTEERVNTIAKDLNKRTKQLEQSRETNPISWESTQARDIGHRICDDGLETALDHLKTARDELRQPS